MFFYVLHIFVVQCSVYIKKTHTFAKTLFSFRLHFYVQTIKTMTPNKNKTFIHQNKTYRLFKKKGQTYTYMHRRKDKV